MSDDSDLEGKMSDTSIEEKKNEESNEQNKTIKMSMVMTSNPLPKNNLQDKKNLSPFVDNIEKKNENDKLNDLENELNFGNKIEENMENKNNVFLKVNEKKDEKKEEIKQEKKEEKNEEKNKSDDSDDGIETFKTSKNPKQKNEFNSNNRPNFNYNTQFNRKSNNFRGSNINFGEHNNYKKNNNFFFMNNNNDNYNFKTDPLYITNKEIIMDIRRVFTDMEEFEILKIIKLIYLNDSRTIFEIMNMIKREYTIINTLKEVKNKTDRQYQGVSDINEMNYEEDIQQLHEEMIQLYKVKNNNKGTEWNYQNEFDKRRELIKDLEGYYNYLPIMGDNNNSINSDIYAKNDNEILYHSLMYKTIICRNKKCSNILCPYAHDLGDDLRLIYDYQKEEICFLMLKLMKCKTLHIENYLDHFEIPTQFNLDNFKILECKLGKDCMKDHHLCYCYHNQEEIRRPPKLFRYINKRCENAQKTPKSIYKPELCPFGIFCHYLHSKEEFNYHIKNFRKVFKCTRKKINGKCIFYETCYGKHDKINVNDNNNSIDDDDKNESNEELNKEIKEYEKNIKNIEDVIKIFFCKKCGSTPLDFVVFILKCGDLFCKNCIKDCLKEEKCLKCQNVIEKNSIMKLDFGLKKK